MQHIRNASLSLQLPLAAALCALVVGVCVVWVATSSGRYLQDTRDAEQGGALAQHIARVVAEPLQSGDLLYVRAYLQRFVDSGAVAAVRVSDVIDLPIAEAGNIIHLEGKTHRAQITIGADVAGDVQLALPSGASEAETRRQLMSLLALVAALSTVVFVLTRIAALRLGTALRALESQLALPDRAGDTDAGNAPGDNEVALLRAAVERLPVDMLRGHARAPAAASDFRDATVLFVHLAGLARYVDKLSESNLHRYTRRLQQLVQAAAQCYRGELRVARQFGLLITFAPQRNAGSDALRAASCARLIASISTELGERTSLSLDLAMALGTCELAPDAGDDMYPDLYLQASVDELRDACLRSVEYPAILLADAVFRDANLHDVARVCDSDTAAKEAGRDGEDAVFHQLLALSEDQEALIAHQSEMIVERIKPAAA